MKKLAIIVREDAYDRVLTPLAFAWLAAASGTTVDLLFVNWAARLLLPGEAARARVASAHADQDGWLKDQVAAAGLPKDLGALLLNVHESEHVHFWVCSLAAQIFGVTAEATDSLCDGVIGATTFLHEYAAPADLTMTF